MEERRKEKQKKPYGCHYDRICKEMNTAVFKIFHFKNQQIGCDLFITIIPLLVKCTKLTHLLLHPVVFVNGILIFWCADSQNRGNLFTKEVTYWNKTHVWLWMLQTWQAQLSRAISYTFSVARLPWFPFLKVKPEPHTQYEISEWKVMAR